MRVIILFSVLLSVYYKDNPIFLQQALESIVRQTLLPSEIVIVEDGPISIELKKVLDSFENEYPNITKLVKLPSNRGLGYALQKGVLQCTKKYIARMDADDISEPNRFLKQISFMKENSEVALLGSWIAEFPESPSQIETITRLPLEDKDIREFAKTRNPFRHMTMVLNRKAVIESGNYREFLWFEDYDLWIRMLQAGYKSANLNEVLVKVRTGNDFYLRRSGLTYMKQEYLFQKKLYKSNFINFHTFLFNLIIRSLVRLMPLTIRRSFYNNFLRILQ